jgi:hypothetical protein
MERPALLQLSELVAVHWTLGPGEVKKGCLNPAIYTQAEAKKVLTDISVFTEI